MKSFSGLFGYHAPIAGGLANALIESRKLDCTAVQIFSRNPRGWAARPIDAEEIERFKRARAENKIEFVAVHASYLINLAAADDVILEKSRAAFREEVERATVLGADCLIVHPGSSKGACEADGVRVCAESLRAACDGINLDGLQILIENTAGQGECIGYRFEHLRDIIAACPGLNLGVCFDTAHAFASGYELRTTEGFTETLAALDECVGTRSVSVVHFNDSKTKFASRVDRHAHVGAGEIGREGMLRVAHAAEFARAAFLLETPQDVKEDTARNLAALRSFLANEES